jgi:hypothetical protein
MNHDPEAQRFLVPTGDALGLSAVKRDDHSQA